MRILLLSTWFPFPLSQGSKIRAYHLIQSLAKENEVALVSFEDEVVQPEWIEQMRRTCKIVEVVPSNPFPNHPIRKYRGWFSLQPSSISASYSLEMASCVKKIAGEWSPDIVFALTYVTAPYAVAIPNVKKVIDVDNLMSRMLQENYQHTKTLKLKIRNYLAWKKFAYYELKLYPKFDLCAVVSEQDRKEMLKFFPIRPNRITVLPNGADLDSYETINHHPIRNRLVYNGALTYKANYEAIEYFMQYIFPLIKERLHNVKLIVTGRIDGVPINSLPINDDVIFTGYLNDIKQVVADSWACVVPLITGGGTRIKIIEAMALGTPVISTTKGAEGLDVVPDQHILIADTPGDFADKTVRLLSDSELRSKLANNAALLVKEKYNWRITGQKLIGELNRLFST
jgi:glycosyltransferase involved in cell wall biosynthesis